MKRIYKMFPHLFLVTGVILFCGCEQDEAYEAFFKAFERGLQSAVPVGQVLDNQMITPGKNLEFDKNVYDIVSSSLNASTGKFVTAIARYQGGSKATVKATISNPSVLPSYRQIELGDTVWTTDASKENVSVDWIDDTTALFAFRSPNNKLVVKSVSVESKELKETLIENIKELTGVSKVFVVKKSSGQAEVVVEHKNKSNQVEISAIGIKNGTQVYKKSVVKSASLVGAFANTANTACVVYEKSNKVYAAYQTSKSGAYATSKQVSRLADVVSQGSTILTSNERRQGYIAYLTGSELAQVSDILSEAPTEITVLASGKIDAITELSANSYGSTVLAANVGGYSQRFAVFDEKVVTYSTNSLGKPYTGVSVSEQKGNSNTTLTLNSSFLSLLASKIGSRKYQFSLVRTDPTGVSDIIASYVSKRNTKFKEADYDKVRSVVIAAKQNASAAAFCDYYIDDDGTMHQVLYQLSSQKRPGEFIETIIRLAQDFGF